MATQNTQEQTREAKAAAQQTGTDPAVLAAAGSVVLSWYYFFMRGERDMGVFVGLWPPTILAFASYFEQTTMADRIERATRGTSGGSVRESVREMVGTSSQ